MDKNISSPLRNRRKEKFCRLYAGDFWGDPVAALQAAGFLLKGKKAADFAETLFDDPEIRARIVHLRGCRAERSLADEAWIKDLLVEIATNALKDSDRIRALTGLAKIISEGGPVRHSSRKADRSDGLPEGSQNIFQPLLPGFEGPADGEDPYSDRQVAVIIPETE